METLTQSREDAGTPPMRDDEPVIAFEDVSFVYPGTTRTVLDHVDLSLPAGSVVAIVGENGAGKSTLVKIISGGLEPTSGRMLFEGTPQAAITDPQVIEAYLGTGTA